VLEPEKVGEVTDEFTQKTALCPVVSCPPASLLTPGP